MSSGLDQYKTLYSKYLDLAVKAHNYHLAFIKHGGGDTGAGLRRCLREMRKLESQLIKLSRVAYKEFKENRKEMRIRAREVFEAWKKANPKPKGRPKGTKNNVKHNRTDQTSS